MRKVAAVVVCGVAITIAPAAGARAATQHHPAKSKAKAKPRSARILMARREITPGLYVPARAWSPPAPEPAAAPPAPAPAPAQSVVVSGEQQDVSTSGFVSVPPPDGTGGASLSVTNNVTQMIN